MTAAEQREYLRSMHADEAGPSGKSAALFESYASKMMDATKSWGSARRDDDETIFVLTASYRDPEVASTIARAYARAARPERIVFGVHAQNAGGDAEPERDPVGGLRFLNVTCPTHPVCRALVEGRIRVSRDLWKRAEGPTVARALAERHYRNETYALGIDSHCHFVRGWDDAAIRMFKAIGNDHAIITAYPGSYDADKQRGNGYESYEPESRSDGVGCIERTRRVNVHTTCSWKHEFSKCPTPTKGPVRVAFFAAGFSFSRGHRILRVPYDYRTPYIFDGEEISLGVRAWTWGYDFYLGDANIVSHLYIPNGSPLRPVFWTTDWGKRWPCQYRSLLRIHRQLRVDRILSPHARVDTIDMEEWDRYDSGPRRDPADFFKWAKVFVKKEWGDSCTSDTDADATPDKAHCVSASLRKDYFERPGGMPYVPWKPGTETLFPSLQRTSQYPPRREEWWLGL